MVTSANNLKSNIDSQGHENIRQCLTFHVAGEIYAIDISHVKEIIEYESVTDVPLMPDFILGIINLRGAVVPVIDLARRFSRPKSTSSKRSCIVIVEVSYQDSKQDIGIMVDGVSEVILINESDVEPAPSFGAHIRSDFIDCMAKIDNRFVVVLLLDNVLSVSEMAELVSVSFPK